MYSKKSTSEPFDFYCFLSIQQFSINHICKAFSKVALSRFGSGWAWLGVADGVLKVTSTANQERFGFKGEDKLVATAGPVEGWLELGGAPNC